MWCTKYRKENKNDKWPNTKTNASAVQQATASPRQQQSGQHVSTRTQYI